MGHIELANGLNLIVIAPASDWLLARYTQGIGQTDLTTAHFYASLTELPVLIAPAQWIKAMWRHPATQSEIRLC